MASAGSGYGTFQVDALSSDRSAAPPSLWSRALLSFVEPVMRVGATRQLSSDDLWALPALAGSLAAFGRFQQRYRRADGSLSLALAQSYGASVFSCGIAMAFCAACDVAAPALLRFVVDALAAPSALDVRALAQWIALFIAARVVAAFSRAHLRLALETTGVQVTASLRMLLFHKALRRHAILCRGHHQASVIAGNSSGGNGGVTSPSSPPASDLANLYSSDIAKVLDVMRLINNLWILPIEIGVMVFMLHSLLGAAAFAGLAVIAASMVVSTHIARAAGSAMRELLQRKDRRMEAVKEVFGSMLAVKIDAFEDKFAQSIGSLRSRELDAVRRFVRYRVLSSFVLWASPLLVSTTSFAVYTLVLRRTPTAAAVFAALALFAALRDPLRELPNVIQTIIQAKISINRLEAFLKLPEYDTTAVRIVDPVSTGADSQSSGAGLSAANMPLNAVIRVSNGTFGYASADSSGGTTPIDAHGSPVLRHVNIEIQKGDLVVVHGPVGSGKSSLCLALLGEICKLDGEVALRNPDGGATAYVSQQPWIQHMTVRDNILFGRAFEPELYAQVLDACALLPDLAAFPAGDMTEIGHKGVNLSGGQRARLALARACYAADAPIVVLDAPLAAVDVAVQREIFSKCIAGGLVAGKTVVMATHNRDVINADVVDYRVEIDNHRAICSRNQPSKAHTRRRSQLPPLPAAKDGRLHDARRKNEADLRDRGRLVRAETREDGRVSARVFREYIDAVGGAATAAVVLLVLLLWQVCQVGSDLWLSHWTSSMIDHDGTASDVQLAQSQRYMLVYACLTTSCAALVLVRSGFVALSGLQGSAKLFERMTRALLGARMRFFDANPIGRVLNRYGEDVTTLDFVLPFTFGGFLVNVFMATAQLVTAVSIVQSIAVLIVPLAWVYARVVAFYLVSSREIGRLRKVAVSPVLSHVAQCEDGAVVIRAFGRPAITGVVQDHGDRNDHNNRILLAEVAVRQWFQLRIELVGCVVVLIVGAGVILLRHTLAPGLAGLAFMYALNVDVGLSALVKVWATVEVQMVSSERVMEYVFIPPEEEADALLEVEQADKWVEACAVSFRNVVFNYKPEDAPVLKGVSFAIEAGEHVGIVGRTGAGKSSLLMALFRINELVSGEIFIGSRNIATLPLYALRSRISMIAQSPVLFRGPLRNYLDPYDAFADSDIWAALDKVGMKRQVSRLSEKLLHIVAANGENMSVGERQLLCMARALLAGNRLVVFDEATAAVDHEAEQRLQRTIAREFGARGTTVLTIAHRLATVMHSDRILVLRAGQVAEFDAPQTLLRDPSSTFFAMAQDAALLSEGSMAGSNG